MAQQILKQSSGWYWNQNGSDALERLARVYEILEGRKLATVIRDRERISGRKHQRHRENRQSVVVEPERHFFDEWPEVG